MSTNTATAPKAGGECLMGNSFDLLGRSTPLVGTPRPDRHLTNCAKAFVAVIDQGSFSSAAKSLGVTIKTVYNRVRYLESRIYQPLFSRRGGVLLKTAMGSEIEHFARRVACLDDTSNADTAMIAYRTLSHPLPGVEVAELASRLGTGGQGMVDQASAQGATENRDDFEHVIEHPVLQHCYRAWKRLKSISGQPPTVEQALATIGTDAAVHISCLRLSSTGDFVVDQANSVFRHFYGIQRCPALMKEVLPMEAAELRYALFSASMLALRPLVFSGPPPINENADVRFRRLVLPALVGSYHEGLRHWPDGVILVAAEEPGDRKRAIQSIGSGIEHVCLSWIG